MTNAARETLTLLALFRRRREFSCQVRLLTEGWLRGLYKHPATHRPRVERAPREYETQLWTES